MKFEDFIERFEKRKKTQLGFMVCCPSHEDGSPSLHVCRANDGGILLKDFGGCTTEQVVAALGLKMSDLFAKEPAKKFNPPPSIKPAKPKSAEKPVIEKIYSYQDTLGREVYQVIRFKPKDFRQRHQNPDSVPGIDDEWIWNMDGVERVLYRLPQISKSQIVWVCEGEKDVENLSLLGIEATCNVGGAGKWMDSYSETLAGKDVVVCGDNDEPGRKHVELVFNSISNISKTVRVVKLPSEIKDVSDYISSFKTTDESRAALLSIIENTHPCVKGKSLPVYSVGEIEDKYRRFVRNMGTNSFSLGKWLPTLGINLRNLVPGELVFVIGDTGSGKTGILQSIAQSALPLPTLIFELELPEELMFERFASMISGMTCDEIERAYQSEDDSLKTLIDSKLPNLCICPISRISVAEMESIIMRTELKLGERPKVVLVDYIQLVKSIGPNRREKISDIAEELKVMAKTTRTIVVCASQISRPQNVDEKWEPSLHSAKESGSIESSCGLLLSAWLDPTLEKTMNIRVLKSTKGGTGTLVCCNFDGSRMKITEKSKISEEDVPKNYAD